MAPALSPRHGLHLNVTSNTGEWTHNESAAALEWRTDTIDADEPSGNLEFTVEGTDDVDSFFPVRVGFVSAGSLAEVQVRPVSASLLLSPALTTRSLSVFLGRQRIAGRGRSRRLVLTRDGPRHGRVSRRLGHSAGPTPLRPAPVPLVFLPSPLFSISSRRTGSSAADGA